MTDWFRQMSCYILAGGKSNIQEDFTSEGNLSKLEKGFRRYAAIFEKVSLVLKKEQAREKYLNYPYVCDSHPGQGVAVGVATALENAGSPVVFIGSVDIANFPLSLVVRLIKDYKGEPFLGYFDDKAEEGRHQPLFGIYHKSMTSKLSALLAGQGGSLEQLLREEGRMLPLPDGVPGDQIGLR